MQWLNEFFSGDKSVGWIAILAACGIAVLVALAIVYRLVFAHRLRVPGGRTRQPRLGLVDAFSLDGQRQLVLIRRDNVEHLVMIGGPNDVLVESQINRALAPGREGTGLAQLARRARRDEPALVPSPALAQHGTPLPAAATAGVAIPHPATSAPIAPATQVVSGPRADGFARGRPRSACSRIAAGAAARVLPAATKAAEVVASRSCGFAAGARYAATRVDAAADHASRARPRRGPASPVLPTRIPTLAAPVRPQPTAPMPLASQPVKTEPPPARDLVAKSAIPPRPHTKTRRRRSRTSVNRRL